ncbi:hypothetical protein FPZ49_22055 [Paenibacillus cremeus]|uniref:Uncharacterized protein n=1 Tax=Paenibacillus cremeus TaxID=2163881 RepID=A0A559K6S5_9BACL|nr:hypothetical protein FPZ49_22055 [Paenibacillus cremeus]
MTELLFAQYSWEQQECSERSQRLSKKYPTHSSPPTTPKLAFVSTSPFMQVRILGKHEKIEADGRTQR